MIDLHTHTKYSDGQQSVADLLQKAEKQGLEFLSITDHDTVDAYEELKNPKIRNLFSGTIIKGIEIYFTHDETQNELLGYGIDINKMSKVFTAEFKFNNESATMKGMHKTYKELGFKLSDIDEMIKNLRDKNIGRVQILNELNNDENLAYARKKFGIKNAQEFRVWRLKNTISLKGEYCYQRPKSPDMKTASNIIRNAGGLVFMAHIFRAGDKAIEMLDYARKNKLIDGVEVYYQDYSAPFTKEQVEFLEQYAKEHNLLICGGSDCHRFDYPLSTLSKKQVAFVERFVL